MNPDDADASFLEPLFAREVVDCTWALTALTTYLSDLKLNSRHGLNETNLKLYEKLLYGKICTWVEMSMNFVNMRTLGVDISVVKSRYFRQPEYAGFLNTSTSYALQGDSWLYDFNYMAGPRDFKAPMLKETAKYIATVSRNSSFAGTEYTISGLVQYLSLHEIQKEIRSKYPQISAIGFVIQPGYWFDFGQNRSFGA